MIRPLVIARPFLMNGSTNGIVERDFFESLPKEIFTPLVICSNRDKINYDKLPYIAVHENILLYNVLSFLGRIGFGDLVYQPDQCWSAWGKNAIKITKDYLNEGNFDYLHSISMTFTNHIVGLNLKRETGLPWIAQFLEPWVDNPFKKYKTRWGAERFASMENEIAHSADAILHTNNAIADIWIKRYGKDIAKKIHVMPIMSKFEQPIESRNKNNDKYIITHIGHFYGLRKAEDFIKSIAIFKDKYPSLTKNIQVNFIGNMNDNDMNLINQYNVNEIIKCYGSMSEADSDAFLASSDMLLVIDPKTEKSLFFPSKLVKYFFAKIPIIGITSKDSVTETELTASGHMCFEFKQHDDIANAIKMQMDQRNGNVTFNLDYYQKFTKTSIIRFYTDIVKSII